jgi:hypothetical protein
MDPLPLPVPDGATLALVEAAAEALLLGAGVCKSKKRECGVTREPRTRSAPARMQQAPGISLQHTAAQLPPASRAAAPLLSCRASVLGRLPGAPCVCAVLSHARKSTTHL